MFCQMTECLSLTPEQAAELDWSILPESCRALREALGALPAAKFILTYAGRARVYVPREKRLREGHELVELLGMEAALKLSAHADGCPVCVPSDKALFQRLVFAFVQEKTAQGWSINKIQAALVIRSRLTTRRLSQIRSEGAKVGAEGKGATAPQTKQADFWRELR